MPTTNSPQQHANNTQFLPVHAIPENPDCFSTLKRRSDSQEVNSFCVRKEKRYCDCPQLDCKHRFYHKSSSLALLREYYQRSGNDPSLHPLFQLNTLLFDTIMDYAKYGSKKLYTNNSQQNEGIIEFISKQNYKNEFINPYTLGIIEINDTKLSINYELQDDMTSLFDANESEEVQLDSEVETTTEENLHLTQTMTAPSPSTVADPKVQYISGDEIIISYPHHAIYPTAYLIQNGGGNFSALTSWTLEGRLNEFSEWILLDQHSDDPIFMNDIQTHQDTHSIHTWKIKNHKEHYYTSFRLRNKSTNPYTHKPLPIYMNKIEFYGYVETFKVVSNSIICRYLEN